MPVVAGNSGYSNFTPASHSKTGQHSGKAAVLLVFSESLHFGLALGNGPQSSTSSNKWYSLPPSSVSDFTQVERPQNGANSQVSPGSTVAHLVEAKHTPGKSARRETNKQKNTKVFQACTWRDGSKIGGFLDDLPLSTSAGISRRKVFGRSAVASFGSSAPSTLTVRMHKTTTASCNRIIFGSAEQRKRNEMTELVVES